MQDTKELFSGHSDIYAKARPTYPVELFEFLASQTESHELAWDVATGNGQAAVEVAKLYKRVVATDSSKQQLEHAVSVDNITYLHLPAELTEEQRSQHKEFFGDGKVDLITVAQAIHWFNQEEFYKTVERVLKPRTGLFARLTYSLPCIDDEINDGISKFYRSIDEFWVPQRRHVEKCYESLPFPLKEVTIPALDLKSKVDFRDAKSAATSNTAVNELRSFCSTHPNLNYILPPKATEKSKPAFLTKCEWNFSNLLNYVETWSSVQLANKQLKRDVMVDARKILLPAWQSSTVRRGARLETCEAARLQVIFPIFLKCGRLIPK